MKSILFLSILIIAVISMKAPSLKQVSQLCQSLEESRSLLFPFKCVTDEERARFGLKGAKFAAQHTIKNLDPVILVPGIGGSGMESQLIHARPPHFYCYGDLEEWRRLWLNLGMLLPGEVNCWYYDVGINFHPNNNTWTNNPGVEIRAIDWGGVEGIDYMDRIWGYPISLTTYFAELIEDLKAVGYVPGKNIRGAPFDWRLADNPNDFYTRFQKLIEDTFTLNAQRKVHLVGHSYGNVHISMFLNTMSQTWKDKYIGSYISIAAPWSGSPKSLRALISGDNFGVEIASWLPILDPLRLRPIIREMGGAILLVPEVAFWANEELVKTPTNSYTAHDLNKLWDDINSPITKKIFNLTDGIMENIQAPKVDLHCLYGINFPTEVHYEYKNGWDKDPIITYSDLGDGTVPERSLRMCQTFATKQSQPVEVKEFDLSDHFTVLNDPELLDYILKIIVEH